VRRGRPANGSERLKAGRAGSVVGGGTTAAGRDGGGDTLGANGGSFGASGVGAGSVARLVSSHGQRISCGAGALTDRGGSEVPLPNDGDASGRGTVESAGRAGAEKSIELGPVQTGGPGTAN
jgi:hypothetical protein